jgi:hypothetical protein
MKKIVRVLTSISNYPLILQLFFTLFNYSAQKPFLTYLISENCRTELYKDMEKKTTIDFDNLKCNHAVRGPDGGWAICGNVPFRVFFRQRRRKTLLFFSFPKTD